MSFPGNVMADPIHFVGATSLFADNLCMPSFMTPLASVSNGANYDLLLHAESWIFFKLLVHTGKSAYYKISLHFPLGDGCQRDCGALLPVLTC